MMWHLLPSTWGCSYCPFGGQTAGRDRPGDSYTSQELLLPCTLWTAWLTRATDQFQVLDYSFFPVLWASSGSIGQEGQCNSGLACLTWPFELFSIGKLTWNHKMINTHAIWDLFKNIVNQPLPHAQSFPLPLLSTTYTSKLLLLLSYQATYTFTTVRGVLSLPRIPRERALILRSQKNARNATVTSSPGAMQLVPGQQVDKTGDRRGDIRKGSGQFLAAAVFQMKYSFLVPRTEFWRSSSAR